MHFLAILLMTLITIPNSFAITQAENKDKKKILFVLTSHSKLGKTDKKTGFWLSEVTHPHSELTSAGFEIDFVSPKGGKAPIDEKSTKSEDPINKTFLENKDWVSKVENTLKPGKVNSKDYVAILYAGGHGTMWDFPNNKKLQKITKEIYENGGVVSAICHGPAGLLNVKLSNGKYLVDGKKVNSFTDEEEKASDLVNVVPFLLETELVKRGASFTKSPKYEPHVAVSERLVTGQNPASAELLAEEIIKLLK